jgi:hypothetical protein
MKTTVLGYLTPAIPPLAGFWITEFAEVSPTLLGYGDDLWVAWTDPHAPRSLHVTQGPALTQAEYRESPSVVVATGIDPAVGLARLNNMFYVAWSKPGTGLQIASSADGRVWTPPVTHPSAQPSAEGVSLVAHDGDLYIAFIDRTTRAGAITWWHPNLGVSFGPITKLNFRTPGVPALAAFEDPLAGPVLFIAIATEQQTIAASRCFYGAVADLPNSFREVAGLQGDAVAMTALTIHQEPMLALSVILDRQSTICTAAFTADPPFFTIQRSDPVHPAGVDLPQLTTVDEELFLGYRNLDGNVEVACYVHACNLDPADPRINQPCDPEDCPPDPRLVCALQPEHSIGWKPASIENARKGDLILSPADGNGVIGTLLGALTPPQIYDHMGIMVKDRTVIRHCTESKDRLKDKRYYTGVLVTDAAPTNGLRSDHITYGWPGIIQQTVEDAFYTGLRGPYNSDWTMEAQGHQPFPLDPELAPLSPADREKAFYNLAPSEREKRFPQMWNSLKFVDPEENFTADAYIYTIKNMPSDPALRKSDEFPDGQLLWPIVVRPPQSLETSLPWVRPLLHRIADASLNLRAHYRFYCYTRGAISIDGSKDGPPKGNPFWSTITQPVLVEDPPAPLPPPDPDNPDTPVVPEPTYHTEYISINGVDWAAGTRPMVCSTFIWASIKAVEKQIGRHIMLEGAVEPVNNVGKPHRPAGTQDGLYAYSVAERQNSSVTLHAGLEREVKESLEEQASGFIGLVADFFAWTSDIADDVATQNVNAFAVDRADEVDNHLWEQPGDGDTVGPDDILLNWDAPSSDDREQIRGLYGFQEPANLQEGMYIWRQETRYQIADGMAHVRMYVGYIDPTNGMPRFVPALVTIGCDSGGTSDHSIFRTLTGAGLVPVKAIAWDPVLQVWLKYDQAHQLHEGINEFGIQLEAPPQWRRRIVWFGETRIYHNPDIGDLQERTTPFASNKMLAWDPDVMSNNPPDYVKDYMTHVVIGGESVKFDDHYVAYTFDCHLESDGTLQYSGEFRFYVDGDLQGDQTRTYNGSILPDSSKNWRYEATHDAFLDSHDYGRVVLTIENNWAKY